MAKKEYYFELAGFNYALKSDDTIYGGIKDQVGATEITSSTTAAYEFGLCGRRLPKLRITFRAASSTNNQQGQQQQGQGQLPGSGGSSTATSANSMLIFCSGTKVGSAIKELSGKTVKGRVISTARFPKKRVYI